MKTLKWLLGIVGLGLLFGLVLPFLFSARSDFAVGLALLLLILFIWGLTEFVRFLIKKIIDKDIENK